MTLKDFVKDKKGAIFLLWFQEDKLNCKKFTNDIDSKFLEMEVMDIKVEEDCLEVWIK